MPTLCLNMIVKNESRIIERLLESVRPIIDYYCIHDTGSTDNTVELINKFSERTGIPGKVIYKPFVNFAVSRTAALVDGCPMADFLLLLDADMVLVIEPDFDKNKLDEADVYHIEQGNDSFQYSNTRIVRSNCAHNYSGVTHEYINTREGARKSNVKLRIHDVGDGGSKSDKYTRDIKLLLQGIEDEPTNGRYYFYLANSYIDTNQPALAIESYKKRIAIGGWDEEVYYSMYKMAIAYRALNQMDLFIGCCLTAWTFRPSRIESIYELVKYYRETSKYSVARGYYHMVRGTPVPSDVLFVHRAVYDYALDYEYSLLAFYANDVSLVYPVYKSLFETSHVDLYAQFGNYKFYVPQLTGTNISLDCRHDADIDGKLCKMRGSSPSILATDTGYLVNVRLVNYTIRSDGSYDYEHGIVVSGNKRIIMDQNFNYLSQTLLSCTAQIRTPDGWGGQRLLGVEDVKLSQIKGEVYFTGTTAHADGRIGMCMGAYKDILVPTELVMQAACEKNWVFLPNRREMIYKWRPLQYGQLNDQTLEIKHEKPMPRLFEMARGSCNGVEFENEWWFVVHFVHKHGNEIRFYYHSIVVFDTEMNLLRYTYPFKFSKTPIEYCLGLIIEPGRLLLTHSVNDSDSTLVIVKRGDVDSLWILK